MASDHSKLQHVAGPLAVAICGHIDGVASSADWLCRCGLSYPVAIEIARQMKAGVGDKKKLFEACGFSIPDSAVLAGYITTAGIK
jgi:hypothetical protein